jgi:histidinol-phosphate aminotransferase
MLSARKAIRDLKEYHPPLAGRNGLRLDFNENTRGASPKILETLRTLDAEELARYPEREPMERLVARFLGVQPDELVLTNGVDEGIQLLCQTYLEAGDEALVVVPTFAMYELFAASAGARVSPVQMLPDFRFPMESLMERISPTTRLIAIANPNNPTGAVATPEALLSVARAAPQAAILIDEAYFEFYNETLISEIRNHPNLFVARTFSKAYGMAGLRVGVLIGCPQQMSMVRKATSPYNVNAVALACLPAALEDQEYVNRYVAEVRSGRERLQEALSALGIRYWPSQGNFVLAEFGAAAQQFVKTMASHGVLVRDRSKDPGCSGRVRITIGTAEQMDLLLSILEDAVHTLGITERSSA